MEVKSLTYTLSMHNSVYAGRRDFWCELGDTYPEGPILKFYGCILNLLVQTLRRQAERSDNGARHKPRNLN